MDVSPLNNICRETQIPVLLRPRKDFLLSECVLVPPPGANENRYILFPHQASFPGASFLSPVSSLRRVSFLPNHSAMSKRRGPRQAPTNSNLNILNTLPVLYPLAFTHSLTSFSISSGVNT